MSMLPCTWAKTDPIFPWAQWACLFFDFLFILVLARIVFPPYPMMPMITHDTHDIHAPDF